MISTRKIINAISELRKKGFFDIFNATVINSMVSFAYGIFIIRILSKVEYGVFSYAQNILTFGFLFCSIGLNIGVLQFCSENRDIREKQAISKLALNGGAVASVLTIICLITYSKYDQSAIQGVQTCLIAMSFLCVLYYIKDWLASNLRWQYRNKEYGIMMNVHSVLNAVCAMIGAFLKGIPGVVVGIYIAYVISIALGCFYLKRDIPNIVKASKVDYSLAKDFVQFSVVMCIVNAMISVLFTVDVFVIGNVLKNAEQVAMYKTATLIPFALNMVPNAIMTFMYPHISKNKDNKEWLKTTFKKLYLANGVLNLCIGIGLFVFSKLIINILFGDAYSGTLTIFRLLAISYIISSTLRTPSANILGMLKMTKTAFIISAFTVVLNILLSYNLVRSFGIIGAAYSSCITFAVVGIVSFTVVVRYVVRK